MNQNTTHPLALLAVLALALLFALPTSLALHCNGSVTEINVGVETLYIDDRSDSPGAINHWIYLERNGEAGLQTGGKGDLSPCYWDHQLFCFKDPCAHSDPDVLIL